QSIRELSRKEYEYKKVHMRSSGQESAMIWSIKFLMTIKQSCSYKDNLAHLIIKIMPKVIFVYIPSWANREGLTRLLLKMVLKCRSEEHTSELQSRFD